ncbi:MAG: spondin domain-containing protein [Caldilineaceae bacterium]
MINRRILCSLTLALALLSAPLAAPALAAGLQQPADADLATYQVTLQNLTAGQPFSPPVAVTHDGTVRLLDVGEPANDALAAIAQAGDPAPMVELLNGLTDGVTAVVNVGQPLAPQGATATVEGATITNTVTFTITAAPGEYLSLAAMLICTNDGLVGLDSATLPDPGEERVIALGAYDAGREENTEQSTDLVDPCSALVPVELAGDPNGNIDDGAVATTPPVAIAPHPGISGEADLTVADHGWVEVAQVTITPLTAEAPDDGDEDNGLVTVQSSNSFSETVTMLQNALDAQGVTVFATIDHAANAEEAGLYLPPTTLILVGNPNLGTPLMQASRSVAIDLPQKFLVWEDASGNVFVTYNDPQYLAQRHVIAGEEEILDQISTALSNFTATATEPAALTPSVTVIDQPINNDTVTVAEAVSDGPGWVVIHADDNGAPGPVIGHSEQLTDGVNSELVIDIDTGAATDTLYAMLHTDAGEAGVYEFPGPDSPVTVDGEVVTPAFMVTAPVTETEPTTDTETVTDTETLTETEVLTDTEAMTGTAAITDSGTLTDTAAVTATEPMTAIEPVPATEIPPIPITETETITDVGAIDAVEPVTATNDITATDEIPATEIPPIPITETETITDVIMVAVQDQAIPGGVVTVDRVFYTGPGWVVIHADDNGAPGVVLGQEIVTDGITEGIAVVIDEEEATPTLWAMLHDDTGEQGVYEFPDADPPVQVNGEIVMQSFQVLENE